MKKLSHWFKILVINIILVFCLIIFLEISAGLGRLVLGKPFLPFFNPYPYGAVYPPYHPCTQMKTDTLLSHVPFHQNKCDIKDGKVMKDDYRDDYVVYKYSSKNNPLLITLGGSTSTGFYQDISKGDTYPKFLAELVAKKYFLVNGAVGGYSSNEEFLKFYRDGPRFKNLEIVISLNGINEYFNEPGKDNFYPFSTKTLFTMNKNQLWIHQRFKGFLNSKFIMNITPNLRNFFLFLKKKNLLLNQDDEISFSEVEDELSFFKILPSADRWEINVKRMNALVKLEGASYLVFLQPTMGIDGPQSYPAPNSRDQILFNRKDKLYFENINKLYVELKIKCSKLEFCIDISDIAPPSGDVYFDARHHNAKGNKIIANEIFKYIQAKFY